MAERRMFAKTIILSDAFLDMPTSARCLYFTLGMVADDDGFVNAPKSIVRQCGSSDDDLRLLIAKRFVLVFESGVIVIKHWRINNYLRNDRYQQTKYIEEKSCLCIEENGAYTEVGIPSSGIPRLGKDRLDKDRLDKDRLGECEGICDEPLAVEERKEERKKPPIPYEKIRGAYNEICTSFPRCTVMSDDRRKAIRGRYSNGYKFEDFQRLFEKAESSSFLKGENKKDWRADFDWLIRDRNMAKVLDGKYDNKTGRASSGIDYGNPDDFYK